MVVFAGAIQKKPIRLIDEIVRNNHTHEFEYHEHESGPEIIAWLALGIAGITVTKSLIDVISTEGRHKILR